MKDLAEEIEKIGCGVKSSYPMSKYTWLRVGGPADMLVEPNSIEELIDLLNLLYESKTPWSVLGEGSNTIVYDSGISGAVISTRKLRKIEILDGGLVLAECGANMGTILNKTVREGLTGFEFAAGIPGTVGGGIFMNAGANDGEIKDVVESVRVWTGGEVIEIPAREIKFEYRKSHLPEGSVVTRAAFRLRKGDASRSERNVKEYMEKRNRTQPIKMSNTGSIFKNPPEIAAGKLIEELGLKGYSIGGAKFSDLHANFIVNTGGASADDVLRLIQKAKEEALSKRGIRLETEVRVMGNKN